LDKAKFKKKDMFKEIEKYFTLDMENAPGEIDIHLSEIYCFGAAEFGLEKFVKQQIRQELFFKHRKQ
jgi:hypothetical protein